MRSWADATLSSDIYRLAKRSFSRASTFHEEYPLLAGNHLSFLLPNCLDLNSFPIVVPILCHLTLQIKYLTQCHLGIFRYVFPVRSQCTTIFWLLFTLVLYFFAFRSLDARLQRAVRLVGEIQVDHLYRQFC